MLKNLTENIYKGDYQVALSNKQNLEEKHSRVEQSDNRQSENDEHMCRICFDGICMGNKLMSPCLCKGTQKFIHERCLKEWRMVNGNNPEKRDKCEVCMFAFVISNNSNYVLYKEPFSCHRTVYTIMFVVLLSCVYGIIDYKNDFFTIKILNLYSTYNFETLRYFRKINNGHDKGYILASYMFFILTFINFGVYFSLMVKILVRMGNIKNVTFNNSIRRPRLMLKIQNCFFPVVYYFSVVVNNFQVLTCMLPIIIFVNFLSFFTFVINSNILIGEIYDIEWQTVHSLEDTIDDTLEIEIIDVL